MSALRRAKSENVMAVLLLAVAVIVAAWEIAAWWSRRPQDPMGVEGRLIGFSPDVAGWYADSVVSPPDPLQINIVSFSFRRSHPENSVEQADVLVRLAHGYNMRDCMRIKGYGVELLGDSRPETEEGLKRLDSPPVQVWRLTDSGGEKYIWVTTMLESAVFSATATDVRSMPFPRVGTPDALDWSPQGVTWRSLRHPVRGLHRFFRSRWNAARCDLLTFLRLRRPAWASGSLLTLVSYVPAAPGTPAESEPATIQHVTAAHVAFHEALVAWGRGKEVRDRTSEVGPSQE